MPKDITKSFRFASFSSVADYHIKKFSISSDIPDWRTIYAGLNFEGICKNKECPAYNKKVWSPLGYG